MREFIISPRPGVSLSSYFICECRPTNPSSSFECGKTSDSPALLGFGCCCGGGGAAGGGVGSNRTCPFCPAVFPAPEPPSDSLLFFAAGSRSAGAGGFRLLPCSPFKGRPDSRSGCITASLGLAGATATIWPESLAFVSPESLALKPVLFAHEDAGISEGGCAGFGAGGHGPGRGRFGASELAIFSGELQLHCSEEMQCRSDLSLSRSLIRCPEGLGFLGFLSAHF